MVCVSLRETASTHFNSQSDCILSEVMRSDHHKLVLDLYKTKQIHLVDENQNMNQSLILCSIYI